MKTPIIDFVDNYIKKDVTRLHVPGHKGEGFFGVAKRDVTEVNGADVLFSPKGIIKESQALTAGIYGSAATVFSTEGSTLAIKEMVGLVVSLAKRRGQKPLILAARNAHKAFEKAAAIFDCEVEWLFGGGGLLSQSADEKSIENRLIGGLLPCAVYITTPDYLGNMLDVKAISVVCKKFNVPLIVDNAHGAYLKFLPQDVHPITLGADMCVDSAHKTLPALTGASYLHVGASIYESVKDDIEMIVDIFSGSSPSYLILQSLDKLNETLTNGYRESVKKCAENLDRLKQKLTKIGYTLAGEEKLKLSIFAKAYGYYGYDLAELLSRGGIECEFCDKDHVVMTFTPSLPDNVFEVVYKGLKNIEKRPPINEAAPSVTPKKSAKNIREAIFSQGEEVAARNALGRVFQYSSLHCPPAVPILFAGEVVDENAIDLFGYYGIDKIKVVK